MPSGASHVGKLKEELRQGVLWGEFLHCHLFRLLGTCHVASPQSCLPLDAAPCAITEGASSLAGCHWVPPPWARLHREAQPARATSPMSVPPPSEAKLSVGP